MFFCKNWTKSKETETNLETVTYFLITEINFLLPPSWKCKGGISWSSVNLKTKYAHPRLGVDVRILLTSEREMDKEYLVFVWPEAWLLLVSPGRQRILIQIATVMIFTCFYTVNIYEIFFFQNKDYHKFKCAHALKKLVCITVHKRASILILVLTNLQRLT